MEEALVAFLLADAGLAALVQTRIKWVERPQGLALPSVILTRVDGVRSYTMTGSSGLVSSRVQIDCWGKTFLGAKTVARAVIAALSGMSGTHRGIAFGGSFLVDEADSTEEQDGGDRIHRTRLDFNIWHSGE